MTTEFAPTTDTRRTFLQTTGGIAILGGFAALGWRLGQNLKRPETAGYGKLFHTADETTGLKLLKLPHGFRYRTFGWSKDPLSEGGITPNAHDGMAVVRQQNSVVTLIRNHERSGKAEPFGREETRYDIKGGGGCTVLEFDTAKEVLLKSAVALNGSLQNCAGGRTPWGTWLTCEEHVGDATSKEKDGTIIGYTREHGWVFEVKPEAAAAPPVPIQGMGRFIHEAVAIDPETGIVYLTEDSNPAGFYRYVPVRPGELLAGGKLEMLKAINKPDTRKNTAAGSTFDVRWVPIEEPMRAHAPGKTDGKGVFTQGQKVGGSSFARLEGAFYSSGRIVITATSGGNASQGQVWEFEPKTQTLKLLFESPGKEILNMPDNLCHTPKGCLALCEDGGRPGQRLQMLTPQGELFPFAENAVVLSGEKNKLKGDYRSTEWSGVCVSDCGQWLFANIQNPGFTVAITGPWDRGPF